MKNMLLNKILNFFSNRRLATAFVLCAAAAFVPNAPVFAQGSAAMRTIQPFVGYDETYQWGEIPEIIAAADPKAGSIENDYGWAADLFFTKEIWQLSFSYKNIRTIEVDFPNADGGMTRKRVWYMVYSVTNTGERVRNELDDDFVNDVKAGYMARVAGEPGSSDSKLAFQSIELPLNNLYGVYKPTTVKYDKKADPADFTVQFAPRFVFASSEIQDKLQYTRRGDGYFSGSAQTTDEGVYYDSFLPLAFAQIVQRERRSGQTFYDSIRIAALDIAPGETVWGVATWTDVDPRIDKFSVYVSGLTNAIRWEYDPEADFSKIGEGRDVYRKVLKLNFVNPGDEIHRGGKEIYNNLPGVLDYQWIYL
ncbi:MAG: hypothetical protein HUK22_02860 [Thermoguttaceae bacterium]|nr:hypothetical protein [Thermoguttaceae bacterium]